ncbi:unnamed protein product [Rotaria sp. Silwood2]|nr:unnamed protein product [Rotaria sp. Silwood2]
MNTSQCFHLEWIDIGNMSQSRELFASTLLANGSVLVTGGSNLDDIEVHKSAELYDPSTRIWTPIGNMIHGRQAHTTLLLTNGKVLATGGMIPGILENNCELYNPSTGA